MSPRARAQESITVLSNDLIGHALETVQRGAFRVYQKNIENRDPPFAHGEFGPCAIAVMLLTAGLDYHLARLKYLRDVAPSKRPLPHTPYFNWSIGDFLQIKIDRLLIKRTEKRLKEQLTEVTIMRDSIAHPKLYLIRQLMKPDYSVSKPKATLSGEHHRKKVQKHKLKRAERTKCLRFPLVPTWISYVDMVVCILVVNRFFNLLEKKYGTFYSLLGGLMARNDPPGFFQGWRTTIKSVSIDDWAQAFLNSLADVDKERVKKRLGGNVSKYLHKHRFFSGDPWKDPQGPEFLRKPPPWPIRA